MTFAVTTMDRLANGLGAIALLSGLILGALTFVTSSI